jgi:cyanophycin synthetase
VGVVLNVTGDHLGLREVETLEQLAAVKQVVVEAVPKTGWAVLNADDPLVLEMRRHCSGQVILFSMEQKHELVDRWIRRGRKALVLEHGPLGELMVLKEGRRSSPIAYVHMLPATFDGRARMMVQNAMAAAAAAHAAGAHLHDIRQGLRSFTTSIYQAPGRLNVFELDGVKVILDYAHNAAGLEKLGDFVDRLALDGAVDRPGEATRAANLVVGVVATAGDRRDEDTRQLGRVAARYLNIVIVREDRNPRGRERGETAELVVEGVREAIENGNARAGTVEVVLDEMEAARKALDRARPGDVVVLCVDYATEVYKELEKRRGTATPAALRPSEGGGLIEAVGGDADLIDLTSVSR